MELISVILPIYNAEKFLINTVNSIINQTYQNWELIIIDDGSDDNSEVICSELLKKDNRIRYKKKNNEGICATRNKGLEMAKGKYICFCDHDDVYEPLFMEKAVQQLQNQNVDIVCASYKEIVIENNKIVKEEIRIPIELEVAWDKNNLFIDYCNYQRTFTTVWNCVYKMETIKNIRFVEEVKYGGEDILFNLETIRRGARIGKIDYIAYCHYKRFGQSTSTKFSQNRIDSLLSCLNQEKIIMQDVYGEDSSKFISKSEAYYLGGIISLITKSNNLPIMKDILMQMEYTDIYKWSYKYNFTRLGMKYDLIYFLFCKRKNKIIYLLSKYKR